jgi:hypothetical protein
VRVGPGGTLVVSPNSVKSDDGGPTDDRRRAVGFCLVLLALAAPLWATCEGAPVFKSVVGVLVGAAMIAAFQLAAARRATPWVVCVPALVLLAHALASRYRAPPSA